MPSPLEVVVRTCNSVIALLSETSTTTSTAIRDPLSGGEGLPLIQKHGKASLPNEIVKQAFSVFVFPFCDAMMPTFMPVL